MTRREAREVALELLFEMGFRSDDAPETILERACEMRETEINDFGKRIYFGVCENLEFIDGLMEKYSNGWKKTRISPVTKAAIRLAIFEMYFCEDIPDTVSQAGAAAVKVVGLLAKDKLLTNPCTAKADELLCNGCSSCANVCPYGAISYEDTLVNDHGIRETRRIAIVNSALCQGCGACTVACPSGAMDLQGFSNRQILSEVDAICR